MRAKECIIVPSVNRVYIIADIQNRTMVRFEDERDGRWYDTVAYPIASGSGEVIKIAIVARDITERRDR